MFLFDRAGGRDFTERDRALLDLLRPHFANLYRAAHTRRRLRAALALLESVEAAVVLVERGNRIAFASPAARELLARYFGSETRLPEQVVAWLRQDRSVHGGPLPVERNGRSLLVHRTKDGLLLEERQAQPRLTPRERQCSASILTCRIKALLSPPLFRHSGQIERPAKQPRSPTLLLRRILLVAGPACTALSRPWFWVGGHYGKRWPGRTVRPHESWVESSAPPSVALGRFPERIAACSRPRDLKAVRLGGG